MSAGSDSHDTRGPALAVPGALSVETEDVADDGDANAGAEADQAPAAAATAESGSSSGGGSAAAGETVHVGVARVPEAVSWAAKPTDQVAAVDGIMRHIKQHAGGGTVSISTGAGKTSSAHGFTGAGWPRPPAPVPLDRDSRLLAEAATPAATELTSAKQDGEIDLSGAFDGHEVMINCNTAYGFTGADGLGRGTERGEGDEKRGERGAEAKAEPATRQDKRKQRKKQQKQKLKKRSSDARTAAAAETKLTNLVNGYLAAAAPAPSPPPMSGPAVHGAGAHAPAHEAKEAKEAKDAKTIVAGAVPEKTKEDRKRLERKQKKTRQKRKGQAIKSGMRFRVLHIPEAGTAPTVRMMAGDAVGALIMRRRVRFMDWIIWVAESVAPRKAFDNEVVRKMLGTKDSAVTGPAVIIAASLASMEVGGGAGSGGGSLQVIHMPPQVAHVIIDNAHEFLDEFAAPFDPATCPHIDDLDAPLLALADI